MTLNVVSNAGPLMVFAKLNLMHLMKNLYGGVGFPYSVYKEVVVKGMKRGFPDAHTLHLFLTQNQWEPTKVVELTADLKSAPLDRGEKDVIGLALLNKAVLLMDEERGRRIARQKGLTVRGSLGILIEAYRKRLISEEQLRFHFEQISERKDIWISPRLCSRLLERLFNVYFSK